MSIKSKWGGSRKGAGRPVNGEKKVQLSCCRISESKHDKMIEHMNKLRIDSQREFIELAIESFEPDPLNYFKF